jgi:hypothetical protein
VRICSKTRAYGRPISARPPERHLKTATLASDHFTAFLPQFVIPANGNVSLQLALLGLVLTVQGALLFRLLAYFTGPLGQWLWRKLRA